jgi:4'-phosphopantetheinyl transferase
MVYIYYAYIDEANHNELIREHLPRFSKEYQEKVLRFHRWQDAQLSLIGRLLLMCGMKDLDKKVAYFQLEYTDYSKPFFSNLDLKFNISHSGNLVMCALSETFDIGVDVELMKDIKIENFSSQMTVYEWEKVTQASCQKMAFYEYWTEKEAVLKAHGKGLSIPLKSFEILGNSTKIQNTTFFIEKIELDTQYKIALAYKKNVVERNLKFSQIKLIELPFLHISRELISFHLQKTE